MRSTTIASGPAVRLAVTAGSVTALLAGCGGGAVRSSATTPVSRPVMLAPVSPGPSATPVPAPVPSTSATPSDLTGCRDGDCEARVREGDRIPIDPGLGVDEITVIGLREDAVRVTFTGTSTVVDGTNIGISRSCYNDRCRVRGALTISVSRPGRIGDVGLRLARVEGDAAVLVLEPAGR
ncbi:hypothetical protein AB0O28_05350 [Microbispora sp. NPDC088329]|uniref:hypothetical protein n=1 Tax=Microbispora sp. NPDC088329 TaxID=3154869 RepID=UPI0034192A6E